ncbi:YEATS domain-containing protein 2-like [Pomacea canaliculata]|uniref:YEATS domain-containing protein 2-like n=1 Tax=Pomacea canaliculata TaxID=400727 RepID=UPI000D72DB3C|nr:YEATS domain-containing protein 2-like [Pomacea canaliculata]
MPRTRRWFSPDHILLPSSSQLSAPGDALVCVSSTSVGDGQLKIKLENEFFDKQSMETEKRILAWKDKKQKVPECRVSPQEPVLSSLRLEDYSDLRTLIRAAVIKHPLIDIESDKFTRPYCAQSWEQWVSWNVGKQRAAEWTRAATVRKYIQRQLGAENKFKGEQLWTTRHIMQWCRLYGQSPHQPGGQIVSSQTCEWMSEEEDKEQDLVARKFSTLSTPIGLLTKVVEEVPDSDSDDASEIDIVSTVAPKTKVKIKKAQGEDLSGTEIFPPSEEATFVQQTAAKIGVKFLPTLMQPNVMTHTCEDMIYAAMLEFSSEILSDACAAHVSSDKPLHTLTVPDVYQALVHMPFSALFTNEHLGSQEEISSCNR